MAFLEDTDVLKFFTIIFGLQEVFSCFESSHFLHYSRSTVKKLQLIRKDLGHC